MITITGLGPGGFDRIPAATRLALLDPGATVVLRTIEHPAARELAGRREVIACDDLYESHGTFEEVYQAIARRVLEMASKGPVVYAVPGSPLVGEFTVRLLLDSGAEVEVVPAESFIDAVLSEVGYDPLDRGLQILNGHHLPDPLVLDKPTVVAQVDRGEVLADVAARLRLFASEGDIEMIVMGAFVHSRFREAVLGGVTRSLLDDAPVPLFMSH